jgi:hypothetical protein
VRGPPIFALAQLADVVVPSNGYHLSMDAVPE